MDEAICVRDSVCVCMGVGGRGGGMTCMSGNVRRGCVYMYVFQLLFHIVIVIVYGSTIISIFFVLWIISANTIISTMYWSEIFIFIHISLCES